MANKPLPDVLLIRKYLSYDPSTGVLTWKPRELETFVDKGMRSAATLHRFWNAKYAGKAAGELGFSRGYRGIKFNGCLLRTHRIIFALVTGSWPIGEIDHINGDRSDNRWCNLRDVSKSDNQRNAKLRKDNLSRHTGIRRRGAKWDVRIRHNRVTEYLGRFSTLEEAIFARKTAERRYGYHENHGRPR